MICEYCGAVFCIDGDIYPGVSLDPQRYCSATHKSKAKRQRAAKLAAEQTARKLAKKRKTCWVMGKRRYSTIVEARQAAGDFLAREGSPLYPYQCACNWWHLTSQPPAQPVLAEASLKGPGTLDPHAVRHTPLG